MKKVYFFILIVSVIGIQSCEDLINDVLPDVNTTLSKTFQIQILQNSGSSAEEIMDISAVNNYSDFKNTIKGYELEKITYQVKNANVPTDMFFSGSISCKNQDGTQTLTVANITRVNISELAARPDSTAEVKVAESVTDVKTVLDWLKAQGKFSAVSSYALTNAQSAPYVITQNVAGSNFELIIRFYIVVKTGV